MQDSKNKDKNAQEFTDGFIYADEFIAKQFLRTSIRKIITMSISANKHSNPLFISISSV